MNLTLAVTLTHVEMKAFAIEGSKGLANYPILKAGEKKTLKFSRSFLAWLMMLSIAVLIFVTFHQSSSQHSWETRPATSELLLENLLPYELLLIFVWPWFLYFRLFKKLRGKIAWDNAPELQRPHTFEITPDAITVRTPTSESRYSWSHFAHFHEGRALFILYNTSKAAQILPKRAFPTPEVAAAFADYCRSRISAVPTAFPVIVKDSANVVIAEKTTGTATVRER